MKKSTIAAAGIVTAISVAAATGLMMSGSTVKRVAQNAAETAKITQKIRFFLTRVATSIKNAGITVITSRVVDDG